LRALTGLAVIGGDHPVVHFRHRATCVEVERVRWVEWQQDKLLALGQARISSPEVEWPAFLLIQVVEFGYDDGAITCSNKTQNTSLRLSLDRRHGNTIHEVTLNPTN
jgi:hypothetical protein